MKFYVNVAQTIGVVGGLVLGFKAIRLEEEKAGISHKPIKEVVEEDVRRVRNWYINNFGYGRMYRHY